MEEHLKTDFRDHTCGSLRTENAGEEVRLAGWAANRRDHGGLIFIDLRDRFGVTQVVVDPKRASEETHAAAESVRAEFVLSVRGKVEKRLEGKENPDMPTGGVEVVASELKVLSPAKTPPFEISEHCKAGEEQRLKYRYLDLRRPQMREAILTRHRVATAVRAQLNSGGFVEIETPILAKSTPEGARDYLVPSRLYPGKFYALPQSPQIFKQLLMVSGFDRYYQLPHCLRDEDLRGNRQPEHTQIDIEMSFAGQEDVFTVAEGVMVAAWKAGIDCDLERPFPRMTYAEAMDRFGIDKPDLRFGLEMRDVSDLASQSDFKIFRGAVERGGIVKALNAKGAAKLSRKNIDELAAAAAVYGAKGLAWIKVEAGGKANSPIAKFFDEGLLAKIIEKLEGAEGDLLLFVADAPGVANASLAAVRNKLGRDLGLIKPGEFRFMWVTDFPLFAWNGDEKRWVSEHHPFTAPAWDDLELLDSDPGKVRSQSYDLVLNGEELASGSVRIHDPRVQRRVFEVLNLAAEEIENRFGFFTEALSYGTPPHAGIAPGLDRVVAVMLGQEGIRDVIAFPKTQRAIDPMTGAPGPVSQRQIEELHLRVEEED